MSTRKRAAKGLALATGITRGWKRRKITGRAWRRGARPIVLLQRAGTYGGDELKFHDLDIDDAVIAANGTIAEDSVLTIAQGDGEQERDGRKMVVKKIGWKYEIVLNSGPTTTQFESVRVLLYHDSQTNGAAATVANLLASDDYQSFNNLESGKRFKTLMDRTYDLNPSGGAGDGTTNDTVTTIISDSFYKDLNMQVTYNSSATTGAIATMMDNNIGVMLLSKNGNTAVFNSKMRVRFVG